MYYLEQSQIINKKIDEVFSFFEKPENLAQITPPTLGFKIITSLPLTMKRGAELEYYIRIFGIPVRWQTLITEYHPPFSFTDIQMKGPYKTWEHTHTFEEKNGGVIMKDVVKYDLYGWIFKGLINKFFVKPVLNNIFTYRKNYIAKIYQ